jgi:hypothetical protein
VGAVSNRDELILANPMIVVASIEKQRDANRNHYHQASSSA